MVILSFTIKDMRDDVEHLESLGKAQTAIVRFNHIWCIYYIYNHFRKVEFNLCQSSLELPCSPIKTTVA